MENTRHERWADHCHQCQERWPCAGALGQMAKTIFGEFGDGHTPIQIGRFDACAGCSAETDHWVPVRHCPIAWNRFKAAHPGHQYC